MEILYLSSLTSDRLFSYFFEKGWTRGYVGQKYHGMFVKGLDANLDGSHITVLSTPPIRRSFFKFGEEQGKVRFRYVPVLSVPFVRQVVVFLYSFLYALFWSLKNIAKRRIVVCSLMRIYQFLPVLWVAALFRSKTVTVVCDIPWMTISQVSEGHISNKQKSVIRMSRRMSSLFDGYVFLTESMNSIINSKNKPYLVVEGFCDIDMADVSNDLNAKYNRDIIVYAGGVNRKYGIKDLVTAVDGLENVQLLVYGTGDCFHDLEINHPSNVVLMGPRSNAEVVESETKAMLLINPRPNNEEYTEYSFPSKTLEYMSSGTFTLTTRLGGIPQEYYDYVGVIDDYSAEGIRACILDYLKKGRVELHRRGLDAKRFVLENKNNVKQGARVLSFISELS